MRNSKILKTQQALGDLGYFDGPKTARKDVKTTTAILAYQTSKSLPATGVLTDQQRELLIQEASHTVALRYIGNPDIGRTSLGAQNKSIQAALRVHGFYQGAIDGQLGSGSMRAVRAYQRNVGQVPTGVLVGPEIRVLISTAHKKVSTFIVAVNNQFRMMAGQQIVQPLPRQAVALAPAPVPQPAVLAPNPIPSQHASLKTGALSQTLPPIEKVDLNAKVRREIDVAIIIGNRNYGQGVPTVSFGHRDADAVKAMIVNDLGFNPSNIIDLRDAGQGDMRNAFGSDTNHKGKVWRFADADGNSNILVYYSGHGAPDISSKTPYLVPVDADPNALEISGYPLSLMYKNLRKIRAKTVMVMLDACFSGGSSDGMLIRSASPLVVSTTMPKTVGSNLTVLTAASGNQLASWDESKGHGIFTLHMVEGMKGAADANSDGKITAHELHAYVTKRVRQSARRTFGREQTPILMGDSNQVLRTN